jgi:NAD(P)-dependent dehydrogenase (short-subunit alcohol dehydrogenase family)
VPGTSRVAAAFDLSGRVAIITGGAGLLGMQHASAIAEMGGIPVLADLEGGRAAACADEIGTASGGRALGVEIDITRPEAVERLLRATMEAFGRVDILINNAANNPRVEDRGEADAEWSRFEGFPSQVWDRDLAVGLTGAFLCSQAIGREMARQGRGVILMIASDLSVVAPDQRLYQEAGLAPHQQPVKPVTYSVVKHGLIGLMRYLATYWAESGVRVNALSMGGVFNGQDPAFIARLANVIPMGRMAHADEYKAAVVFAVSDASSYMTGTNLIVDGGRTVW